MESRDGKLVSRHGSRSFSTTPLDAAPSWPALHEVLRDQSRNFLFNHLGLGEDEMKHRHSPRLRRPSVLLARVFRVQDGAAVRVLEMHARRRRQAAAVPRVVEHPEAEDDSSRPARTNNRVRRHLGHASPARRVRQPGAPPASAGPAPKPLGLAAAFGDYLQIVANGVHSGSGRTAASDNNTDYYPVSLTQETLRPGTVYADPYGHILMIVRRVPQSDDAAGVIPRGRRAARRDGRAKAILARQFPVRAGSRARRPRVQALPADRARDGTASCGG